MNLVWHYLNPALDFMERSFNIDGAGWTLLIAMCGLTIFMIFAWVEHWTFRMICAPGLVLGAVACHNAMSELGLHVSTDATVNQGVGFGLGIFIVAMVVSTAAWTYYEFAAD